jgi:hypothetical protein
VIKNYYLQQNASNNGSISVFFHNWEFPFVSKKELTEVGPETAINE